MFEMICKIENIDEKIISMDSYFSRTSQLDGDTHFFYDEKLIFEKVGVVTYSCLFLKWKTK